jgi:hypothetical protein
MPAARTLVARSCAPARSRCITAPASLSQVMDTDESGALYPLGWEGGWEREVANARGKEGLGHTFAAAWVRVRAAFGDG